MRVLILCSVVLAIAGCQNIPQNEGKPATVADVVSAIKADIGVYQAYDAIAAAAKPLNNACQGIIGFNIDSVKVSLTTQTDNTTNGTGTATLPVGSTTFGPSIGASKETKGTQTLTFTLYPKMEATPNEHREAPEAIDANRYPIAASLQLLRNGLLEASQKKPCMSLVPPGGSAVKDDGGTYAFGFTVINQDTVGANLKFLVFSLGATNTAQRQAGNTITVTFKARPGSVTLKTE